MTRYLLDNPVVAAFLHGRLKALELITPGIKISEAATSILVYGEVIEYLKGLTTLGEYKTKLQKLFRLKEIAPYPLSYPILEKYADIRRYLRPFIKILATLIRLLQRLH